MVFNSLVWLVALSIALVEMATDIYAPSLPQIAEYFNSPSHFCALTISFNLIGLSLSGLIYGPLSDRLGRRPVMLGGITLFFVGGVLCLFSPNITWLIVARFIQGCGGGVALVVGMASIYDTFKGSQCAKVLSRLGMVIALSPGLAPVLGGKIAAAYSWHMIFMVISIAGFGAGVLLCFLLPRNQRTT